MNNYFNTKVVAIQGSSYCKFCGKKIIPLTKYGSCHENIPDESYCPCDCDSALSYREMLAEFEEVKEKYKGKIKECPKQVFDDIRYQNELTRLNSRFGR